MYTVLAHDIAKKATRQTHTHTRSHTIRRQTKRVVEVRRVIKHGTQKAGQRPVKS